MEPSQELIDDIYAEKVRRARRMPPAEKLMAGAVLFEYVRTIMEAGIRHQHPGATPEQVRELLRQRLRIARRLDER